MNDTGGVPAASILSLLAPQAIKATATRPDKAFTLDLGAPTLPEGSVPADGADVEGAADLPLPGATVEMPQEVRKDQKAPPDPAIGIQKPRGLPDTMDRPPPEGPVLGADRAKVLPDRANGLVIDAPRAAASGNAAVRADRPSPESDPPTVVTPVDTRTPSRRPVDPPGQIVRQSTPAGPKEERPPSGPDLPIPAQASKPQRAGAEIPRPEDAPSARPETRPGRDPLATGSATPPDPKPAQPVPRDQTAAPAVSRSPVVSEPFVEGERAPAPRADVPPEASVTRARMSPEPSVAVPPRPEPGTQPAKAPDVTVSLRDRPSEPVADVPTDAPRALGDPRGPQPAAPTLPPLPAAAAPPLRQTSEALSPRGPEPVRGKEDRARAAPLPPGGPALVAPPTPDFQTRPAPASIDLPELSVLPRFSDALTSLAPEPGRGAPDPTGRPLDVARSVQGQLIDVARQSPDGTVEVKLAPEELGRVRMVISQADADVAITVLVERAETLDLMRRHADVLSTELRQAGFERLSFSFGQGGDPKSPPDSRRPSPQADRDGGGDTETLPTVAPALPARVVGTARLDIRL